MKQLVVAVALSIASVFATQSVFGAATLLTSEVGYTGPGLNLSAYANGNYNFTFGPINVDGFTFTASPGGSGGFPFGGNSGQGSVVGQGGYGLNANGSFGGDAVYIGVDSGTGYAQLLGTTGYSQIGFFMNYAPRVGNDPVIETLDDLGNVMDSFNLASLAPISTPGGFNAFQFRGVAYDGGQLVYGLRFGGSYILLTGTADGVVAEVPEPSTCAIWGVLGLCVTAAGRYRSRQTK